jgi:hypothetical protein
MKIEEFAQRQTKKSGWNSKISFDKLFLKVTTSGIAMIPSKVKIIHISFLQLSVICFKLV